MNARRAPRVLITTVPFGQHDQAPLARVRATGADVVINPIGRRLKEAELRDMLVPFDILIAGTEPITADVLRAAPDLRCIVRVGIGLDNVDLGEARRRNIAVAYTPDAPSPAVAELTVGLMLAVLRDIGGADRRLRAGEWRRVQGRRLSAVTVGLIGIGRIGRRVAAHLSGGFPGVRLLANDIAPDVAAGERYGLIWVSKEELYREADVVSLHVPLTPRTRGLISGPEIDLMKPRAVLINTSRGGVVHERDLATALRAGRIAGAAIDVFEREPYEGELTTCDGCLMTCHMGSMSEDCRTRMEAEATDEVIRFLQGQPLANLVPESEYALSEMMR